MFELVKNLNLRDGYSFDTVTLESIITGGRNLSCSMKWPWPSFSDRSRLCSGGFGAGAVWRLSFQLTKNLGFWDSFFEKPSWNVVPQEHSKWGADQVLLFSKRHGPSLSVKSGRKVRCSWI
jgi:hypothetical protein